MSEPWFSIVLFGMVAATVILFGFFCGRASVNCECDGETEKRYQGRHRYADNTGELWLGDMIEPPPSASMNPAIYEGTWYDNTPTTILPREGYGGRG